MQTEETFAAARAYARECDEHEWAAGKTRVVSVHMLTNGYEQHHRNAGEVWLHAVRTFNASNWRTLVLFTAGETWKHATSALYVLDYGDTIAPWYVAGWFPADGPLTRLHLCRMEAAKERHRMILRPAGRFIHGTVSANISALEGQPF